MRGGEVDIIARRRRILAFIEVKARATEEAAALSLDAWRIRRVVVAAERAAVAALGGLTVLADRVVGVDLAGTRAVLLETGQTALAFAAGVDHHANTYRITD